MSIFNWFASKEIKVTGTIVRACHPKKVFGLCEIERVLMIKDTDDSIRSVVCDLDSSPEANLAVVGDRISFTLYQNDKQAYDLTIIEAAATMTTDR